MDRDIETELTELQLRHKLHQQKMEEQRLRKIQAREDHHRGIHRLRFSPHCLK